MPRHEDEDARPHRQCGQELGDGGPAELACQERSETGDAHDDEDRRHPQRQCRVGVHDLGEPGQQRSERRLVGVAPRGSSSGRQEVQLVTVVAVASRPGGRPHQHGGEHGQPHGQRTAGERR